MGLNHIRAAGGSLDDWLKRFFEGQKGVDKAVWQGTYNSLVQAVHVGTATDLSKINYKSPDFELAVQLEQNAGVFSAFKNHAEQDELAALLKDENGKARSWHEFKKLAEPVTDKYNKRWLETEYNQAVASAQMAKKWNGFEANADIYPNLEYRAVGDKRARPDHAKLNGTVLPINDDFWSSNYPPNGWGCRCSVTQTDKEPTEGASNFKPGDGFDFNPGIEKKLFADSAPYFKSPGKDEISQEANKLLMAMSRKYGFDKAGKVIKAKGLGDVKLTKKGIHEALNQPHPRYYAKNSMVLNIEDALQDLEWEILPDVKNNPMIKQYHRAEIELMGEKSYLIVRELMDGTKIFYGITGRKFKK